MSSCRLLCRALMLVLLLTGTAAAGGYEKAAPWDGVRFLDDGVEVHVADGWYRLVSIDGRSAGDVLAYVKKEYGSKWQKRFGEDLVEVLARMGKTPGKTVALVLAKDGKEVTRPSVAMTHANRQAVRDMMDGKSRRKRKDDDDFAKLAPWDAVRWPNAESPQVRVQDAWFDLVSIDDVHVMDLMAFCRKQYRGKWKRRFAEDLVQVLTEMGNAPGPVVTLVLDRPDKTGLVTKKNVPMTEANRDAILRAAHAKHETMRKVNRVTREHASKPDPQYEFIAKRVPVPAYAFQEMIPAAKAAEDLDQLEWHLANEFSYLEMRGVDYKAALDTIRLGLGEQISRGDLTLQVQRLLCTFGDAHSRVRGLSREIMDLSQNELRFAWRARELVLVPDEAVRAARNSIRVEPTIVQLIDGVRWRKWVGALKDIVHHGSEAYVNHRIARDLRYVAYVRAKLGLPAKDVLTIGGRGVSHLRTVNFEVPLADGAPRKSSTGAVHFERKGYVGYLRIREMESDDDELARIDIAMQDFKSTKGMVIDVRGNGGGSRAILRALFPYFMKPGQRHIANVAAYRLPPGVAKGNPEGYLENRALFPVTSSVWDYGDRRHIRAHLESFAADMTLRQDKFSAWHVMLLQRSLNPKAYHYDKPVVVLMDGGCFSATDIFLGAFKGWDNVTLMGTASGGGSGRSRGVTLANSKIRLKLSSMASFRPTGERYDGVGIKPDVTIERPVTELGTDKDSVLDRALASAYQDGGK